IDGTTQTHRRTTRGWAIESSGPAGETIELSGRVAAANHATTDRREFDPARLALRRAKPHTVLLGEAHYRRSEESWRDAGSPSASVTLEATGRSLNLTIVVPHSDRTFVHSNAVNRYDNEAPDVNGDGVQIHLRTPAADSAWMLVPEHD